MATSPVRERALAVGIAVAALLVLIGGAWLVGRASGTPGHVAAVAVRGASVMPFDLERTTHVFTPTATGGVQVVVADAPVEPEQVDLVRRHLRTEAARFAGGDFGDPAEIHGEEMPGLEVLIARARDLQVAYSDVPDGGSITYASDDAEVVDALHAWFEAQLRDHGDDAERG
jgi:hypothetical protein